MLHIGDFDHYLSARLDNLKETNMLYCWLDKFYG